MTRNHAIVLGTGLTGLMVGALIIGLAVRRSVRWTAVRKFCTSIGSDTPAQVASEKARVAGLEASRLWVGDGEVLIVYARVAAASIRCEVGLEEGRAASTRFLGD